MSSNSYSVPLAASSCGDVDVASAGGCSNQIEWKLVLFAIVLIAAATAVVVVIVVVPTGGAGGPADLH